MPDEKRPVVAVVMLTLDQRASTLRALASIDRGRLARVEILLFDNGSSDETAAAVRDAFPTVHVHRSEDNLGVAGGRNAGAALAVARWAPRYLCFLDNDLVLADGFLDALVHVLDTHPDVGQVQAKLRYLDRPDVLQDGGGSRLTFWNGHTRSVGDGEIDRGQRDRMTECISLGGAMMVRTGVFLELGGFDTAFNPFGPEDIDFSLRLRKRGHRALYVPAAMAYHAVSHTFEPGGYSARYARLKAEHWLRLLGRHASPAQRLAFYAAGMPLIALKLLWREVRRGNPGAIIGSIRGVVSSRHRQ